MSSIDPELKGGLLRLGLIAADEAINAAPLTGGVASDIWLVDARGRRFVVKRALARLRVEQAAARAACNAVLVKPNQAGTVTETREALLAGKAAGFGTIVSARSGESEDVTIAHLAVGWDAGQLKVGSIARGERTAKWNEMPRIGEALGPAAPFAGDALRRPGR